MSDVTFYTHSTPGYDQPREDDYVRQVESLFTERGATYQNRWAKLHPSHYFEDGAVTVYIDGSIMIRNRALFEQFVVEALKDSDIAIPAHPAIDCTYEALDLCIKWRKWNKQALEAQAARYRAEGFPEHAGLWANMVVASRNTPEARQVFEAWWNELLAATPRDVSSLPVVAHRLGFKVATLPLNVRTNPCFAIRRHLQRSGK